MSGELMPKTVIEARDVPEGWSVQGVQYHRGFAYWASLILDLVSLSPSRLASVSPSGQLPDATYTVRRDADGAIRTIRLRGDQPRDALAKAIQPIESDAAP